MGHSSYATETYALCSSWYVVDGPLVVWTGASSLPQSLWPRSLSTTAVAWSRPVLLVCAARAVFPWVVAWPVMFGIMAGMDQKDSYAARCHAHCRLRQWHIWLVLLVTTSSLYSFLLSSAGPRCAHHGRCGPEGVFTGSGMCKAGIAGIFTSHAVFLLPFTGPDALSWTWSFTRLCVQRHTPMVQTAYNCGVSAVAVFFCSSSSLSWRRCRFSWSFTTEFHQLQYIDKVVDVCCAGCCMSVVCNNICLGR